MPESLDQLKARRASVAKATADLVAKIRTTADAQIAAAKAAGDAELSSIDVQIAAFGFELLGGVAIGTPGSYQDNGYTLGRVFDGDLTTYFDAPTSSANNAWVGLDLGEPREIAAIAYAPRAKWSHRMVGGLFQASNDPTFAIAVTKLFAVESVPAEGVLTTVSVDAGGAFRYVRYLGPKGAFGNVAELQFYGRLKPVVDEPKQPDGETPKRACRFSLIMDVAVDSLIDELNAAGARLWGNFGTNGTVNATVMKRANDFARKDRDVAIVLTPKTNLAAGTAIDFTAVVDQFIAQADRRIRPNFVNEGNQLVYWPNGGSDVGARWLNAMRTSHPSAQRMLAGGFAPGCVSVTGYDEKWEEWFARADAEGLLDAFPRLVFHIYGADLATIRCRVAIARKIADRYGKQLDFDECGFAKTTTLEQATTWFPEFVDAISVADYASWFIATKTNDASKPDHDKWAWFVDPKTGERREAWIKVAAARLAKLKTANGVAK